MVRVRVGVFFLPVVPYDYKSETDDGKTAVISSGASDLTGLLTPWTRKVPCCEKMLCREDLTINLSGLATSEILEILVALGQIESNRKGFGNPFGLSGMEINE
jgi:hypothetical protein